MCSMISNCKRLRLPAQQPGREVEMRGAADRQELRETLDNAQDDHLRDGHKSSACGMGTEDVKCAANKGERT